jgi:hypothetical protein
LIGPLSFVGACSGVSAASLSSGHLADYNAKGKPLPVDTLPVVAVDVVPALGVLVYVTVDAVGEGDAADDREGGGIVDASDPVGHTIASGFGKFH